MLRFTRLVTQLVVALAITAAACQRDVAAPATDRTPRPHAATVSGLQTITGELGPGAPYVLYLPETWNGDLVLLVKGYGPSGPRLPADAYVYPPERDGLLALGYGVAASSFSYGGFEIKDAMVRTAQLEALFGANFGRPARTYIISFSLGATVAMQLAEQNPQKYAGVLPLCGVVAGVPFQLNHYFNTRVLFDHYFPGVLPGDALSNPNGIDLSPGSPVRAALNADLGKAAELAGIDQVEMAYATNAQLVDDITFAVYFNAWDPFTNDIMAQTHGHSFFDNSLVQYTGSSNDALLNEGVARFTGTPDAANMVRNLYSPTGKLRTRVLTLHPRYDPIVPIRHEYAYAALVAAQGASDMLVTRIFERAGHCPITIEEELTAFQQLATWAKTGVKPAP